jgi:hypothetical protein
MNSNKPSDILKRINELIIDYSNAMVSDLTDPSTEMPSEEILEFKMPETKHQEEYTARISALMTVMTTISYNLILYATTAVKNLEWHGATSMSVGPKHLSKVIKAQLSGTQQLVQSFGQTNGQQSFGQQPTGQYQSNVQNTIYPVQQSLGQQPSGQMPLGQSTMYNVQQSQVQSLNTQQPMVQSLGQQQPNMQNTMYNVQQSLGQQQPQVQSLNTQQHAQPNMQSTMYNVQQSSGPQPSLTIQPQQQALSQPLTQPQQYNIPSPTVHSAGLQSNVQSNQYMYNVVKPVSSTSSSPMFPGVTLPNMSSEKKAPETTGNDFF